MYSTRSGATPRIASLMAELGKSAKPPAEKGKGAARPPRSAEGALRPLPCARPAPDGGGRALRERGVPSSRGLAPQYFGRWRA